MNKFVIAVGLLTVPCLMGVTGCSKTQTPKAPIVAASDKKTSSDKDTAQTPEPMPPVVEPAKPPRNETPKPVVVAPMPMVVPKKERSKPTETIALTALAFGDEIRKSPTGAGVKFESVFVELSGIVQHVGSRDKMPYVTLDAGPESLGVICVLVNEKEPWAKISKGQKIKLRGQWPEFFVQPELVACELLETGPNPAQELTAEALAMEFVKTKDAVRNKYKEKPLILNGLIEQVTRNELGAVRLFLKGAGDLRVDCGFDAGDRAEAEAQVVGGRVRLTGEFSFFESNDSPALRGCRVIAVKKE